MKVCIAEKPAVAREIASCLGATTKRDGYIEGNGYQVTWTYGHLCTLKEPDDYNPVWKRWALNNLPMIPQRFGIKPIPQDIYIKQLNIIKSLIDQAEEVINCGDAGQEGELIQRWVLQYVGCKCPVKRLWISSLTAEAIKEGFEDLKPSSHYETLYEAGLARAIGDWMLGMNATRLYTLRYGAPKQILSVGRVQTPTLALLVQRRLEIENFVPQPYWELKTTYREVVFNASKGRFESEDEAREAAEKIKDSLFEITSVKGKKGKELPPSLFDLTSLQVECNKKYGLSAEETLKTIQSLYEKKLTTYPRVDTTYLPDDIYPKVPTILQGLFLYKDFIEPLFASPLRKSKKVFDNSKITDHHAIIPTGQPGNLVGNEAKVYDLIARRFIAAFYPDCLFNTTTVEGEAAKIPFKATGKTILQDGWKVLFQKVANKEDEEDKKDDDERTLPDFKKGESGPHTPDLQSKFTQPPKQYTEATLLRTMETAGKLTDDEDLRQAMKENGIGRPSTRANIIETLMNRTYVERKGKSLIATDLGVKMIELIQSDLLKSVELTGLWERKLRLIEKKEVKATDFIAELKNMVMEVVAQVLYPQMFVPKLADVSGVLCPKCHKGHLLRGNKAFGCSEWKNGCDWVLPYSACPATSSLQQIVELAEKYK